MLNGYLTKVNLGHDLLTHINLLLAVVVVMMVGATVPMPFCTAVVMLVMTMFAVTMFTMTMMFVMVML